jgi:uncharacterized MAPEG superfamily protein
MWFELKMLVLAMALGIVQMLLASGAATAQRGWAWNASARDGQPAPLTGVAARLDRAWRNYLETFPFFAAAVLAVVLMQRQGAQSELAVQIYLGARIVYIPLYAAGIPYVRSAVWVMSMVGIVMLLVVALKL